MARARLALLSVLALGVVLLPSAANAGPTCFGKAATIVGTGRAERIRGTGGADVIVSLGGGDLVRGLGGNDRICTGGGQDLVLAGKGNDRVDGGKNDDGLIGHAGADRLEGGDGNDQVDGGGGKDTVLGQAGHDELYGGSEPDELSGGGGDDLVLGWTGSDVLRGGSGHDILDGQHHDDRLIGGGAFDYAGFVTPDVAGVGVTASLAEGSATGRGNDILDDSLEGLIGSLRADELTGDGGPNGLYGLDRTDHISGGSASDFLSGGAGDDLLLGQGGDDLLQGNADSDRLDGGPGRNEANGGGGTDWCARAEIRDSCEHLFTYPLTVTPSGNGTVEIAPTSTACSSSCTTHHEPGTHLTLTATAADGHSFAGWGGACAAATTATCDLTIEKEEFVSATFVSDKDLSVTVLGGGVVTDDLGGIDCGSDCGEAYRHGTVVTLTPQADPGWTFLGWSGACTGTGTCQVTMDAHRSVTAEFWDGTYRLTVWKAGTGQGTVTDDQGGIDCGPGCGPNDTHDYDAGTVVTLTAEAALGSVFEGWSGDGQACGTAPQCQVTMNAAKAVTATFDSLLP